jgi:hypothetical protein
MTDEAFEQHLEQALAAVERHNRQLREAFGIGLHQQWKADLGVPVIRFLDDGAVAVEAEIIVVGTLGAGIWKWGWANARLPAHVRAASAPLQALREVTGHTVFTDPQWQCDDPIAWWTTALAFARLGGEGVYRMPGAKADIYALLRNVRRMAKPGRGPSARA